MAQSGVVDETSLRSKLLRDRSRRVASHTFWLHITVVDVVRRVVWLLAVLTFGSYRSKHKVKSLLYQAFDVPMTARQALSGTSQARDMKDRFPVDVVSFGSALFQPAGHAVCRAQSYNFQVCKIPLNQR